MQTRELSSRDYEEFVSSEGITVVDFWAPWCAPCKAMKPVLEGLPEVFPGRIRVGLVDIDEEGALAGKMNVASIPHMAVYKDGDLVDTIVGALPPMSLKERIGKLL